MKKYVLGLFSGAILFAAMAAVMPFQLHKDSSGNVLLESPLVASNGVTVITNLVIKSLNGPGLWKIVVTNDTGTLNTVTNN